MMRLAMSTFILITIATPKAAEAQQSLTGVLSFLMTNRSIPTGDFTGDQQAAAAASDAIAGLLQAELSMLPLNSPASGFTYRLDPALGVYVRSSDSFGPFFVERSLTGGRHVVSFSLGYTQAIFDNIDGRPLNDGTLVATASRVVGDTQAFDAETLSLRLETRTFTLSGQVGITDWLDVSATVPFVSVNLSGERVDTYHGAAFVQASADATFSGLGDVVLRMKVNVVRRGSSGLAFATEVRLPTGDADNLLGGAQTMVGPKALASYERGRFAAHGQVGYVVGGVSNELAYGGAATFAASPRVTFSGEILGRRLDTGGRLTEVIAPHPDLAGIETIRLSAADAATSRAAVAVGIRWNVTGRWLLSANVLRPLTTAGLNARWVPSVTLDYSLGR